MDSKKIVDAQLNAYRANFLEHGDSPKGTFWNDKETQYLRYERVIRQFDLKHHHYSVHDIGCGMCDMHQYLLNQKIKHTYVGSEIVPEMIEASQKKFPYLQIHDKNILLDTDIPVCDLVVLSGTFNLPGAVSQDEWKQFAFDLIKRMFEISRLGVSFNMLTSHRTFTDPTLAYFDPSEVFDFCIKNLTRFIKLDHAYPLYEYTITLFHKEFARTQYPDAAFDKYFK